MSRVIFLVGWLADGKLQEGVSCLVCGAGDVDR